MLFLHDSEMFFLLRVVFQRGAPTNQDAMAMLCSWYFCSLVAARLFWVDCQAENHAHCTGTSFAALYSTWAHESAVDWYRTTIGTHVLTQGSDFLFVYGFCLSQRQWDIAGSGVTPSRTSHTDLSSATVSLWSSWLVAAKVTMEIDIGQHTNIAFCWMRKKLFNWSIL